MYIIQSILFIYMLAANRPQGYSKVPPSGETSRKILYITILRCKDRDLPTKLALESLNFQ